MKQTFFRDKSGKVVIGQWPNRPLWYAILFYFLQFVDFPYFGIASFWGVKLSLLYWAYLEIVSGVNGWRKLLGWVVAGYQVYQILF